MVNKRVRLNEWLITGPSLLWLTILFAVPSLIIFTTAFRPADIYGGVGSGWTLETLKGLSNPSYPAIVWRTIRLSVLATGVCLVLATPCAYCMARAPVIWRSRLMVLIVLPFWTSFLVRVFAWKVLLHPDGPLKRLLLAVGIINPGTLLLYNEKSILLVMVYTYLPFAILPIYAAAERFDFQLIEAARDLGASPLRAFFRVFVPGIRTGLWSAILMVFIPALGSYVIPDLMGGATSEMVGNKIAQRVFVDRNIPHASALAAWLTLAVMVPLAAAAWRRRTRDRFSVEDG